LQRTDRGKEHVVLAIPTRVGEISQVAATTACEEDPGAARSGVKSGEFHNNLALAREY
jgi:hypothetical protein